MDKWDKVVDTIVKTIDARIKKPSSAYSTEAQVKRIEGQTAYVDIPGGEPNMPARLTIDAKVGDTVQVSVDDHKATLTGNRTAPPTDDTTANEAKDTAEKNKRKVIKLEEQTGLIRQGVEGAQNMARQAEEDAENALTAANGKNTVYYLATQPTGGTYQIGDTWFDTANDNKIYHWNGTAWTASLLGDDALDTFSANHINAGSIDASNVTISNLNAGNITSGYLNSARIETGSLSISKTSGLQSAIDDAAETATDYLQATSTGLKVGKDVGTTSNYSLVTSGGFSTYASNVEIFNAGYGNTNVSSGTGYRPYYTLGTRSAYSGSLPMSEGGYSLAAGYQNCVPSYCGAAIGINNKVYANYGFAIGEGLYVNSSLCLATGYYNKNVGAFFVVGDGDSDSVRHNCLEVYSMHTDIAYDLYVGRYIRINNKAPFTTFTATGSSSSLSSGSGAHVSCTGTVPTGYTPIAIQSITSNHTYSGVFGKMSISSNGADVDVINRASSSQSFTITATILCTAMN